MTRRLSQPVRLNRWPGMLVLLAVALLWPSMGFASGGNFLFPAGDGSCYDVEPLKNHGEFGSNVTEIADAQGEDPPCTVDDSDPASNVCLEAANSPISTLPRLLIETNGKETAESVVNSILARMEANDVRPDEVTVAITPSPEPAPSGENSKVACSTDSEECRALPPVPPSLQLDASAPAARELTRSIDLLDAPGQGRINAWAHLRVGPEDGHSQLPDRPPRRA
ncbi:MAG: hypothetical protein ACQEVA_19645 [Myxococcota bacterium]